MHIVAARTLYYKVRPLIQQFTDKELDYAYFSQTLLPEYERTVAPLPGLYYEARGELHHPHDDEVIRLGTREVEAYMPPSWQFDKVLYIEKEGLEAQLAPYRLGQRYDMAIIYGKGYSPTACRNLLARSDIRDDEVLRPARRRHRRIRHRPHPRGSDPAHAQPQRRRHRPGFDGAAGHRYGLETEKFTRRKELPADLELDEDARDGSPAHRYTPGTASPTTNAHAAS